MLPIVDKSTLKYIIEEATESGIEKILIITGRNKSSIENHFDKSIELELEGDKLGFLQATVEYALRNEELSESFFNYLTDIVKNKTDKIWYNSGK